MRAKTPQNPLGAGRKRYTTNFIRNKNIRASSDTIELLSNCVPGCDKAGNAVELIAYALANNFISISTGQVIDIKDKLQQIKKTVAVFQ